MYVSIHVVCMSCVCVKPVCVCLECDSPCTCEKHKDGDRCYNTSKNRQKETACTIQPVTSEFKKKFKTSFRFLAYSRIISQLADDYHLL